VGQALGSTAMIWIFLPFIFSLTKGTAIPPKLLPAANTGDQDIGLSIGISSCFWVSRPMMDW